MRPSVNSHQSALLACYGLLLWLLGLPGSAFAQSTELPAFYPTAEHSYGIKEGLPDMAVAKVFLDKAGRLNISISGGPASNKWLYEYYGGRAYPADLELKGRILGVSFQGIDSSGRIYGGQYNKNGYSLALIYDPLNRTTKTIDIGRFGHTLVAADGALFALASPRQEFDSLEILRIQDGSITSLHQLAMGTHALPFDFRRQLAITADAFWVGASSHQIYRISRKDGTVQHFSMPGEERYLLQMVVSPNQDVWITACSNRARGMRKHSIAIYQWDHQTGRFVTNPYKPAHWKDSDLSYATAFSDTKGNILLSYRNHENVPSATLLDPQGRLYDYSGVMSQHELAYSADFKQGVIFHMPGLRVVEVTERKAMKKNMYPKNPRWMLEWDPETILMGDFNTLSYQQNRWILIPSESTCVHSAWTESDVAKDMDGNVWFAGKENLTGTVHKLMRYRPAQGLCDTFNIRVDLNGVRFDFLDKGQMVLAYNTNLHVWDIQSPKPRVLQKLDSFQPFNQVFVDNDRFIWLATGQGLLKIDPQTARQEMIDLIPGRPSNVMRIHQDKKGRIWVATATDGIVIYDPVSGKKQVINQTSGLSSNIVVTLLEDNDGNIWAGTFFGITVLSPDGTVIDRLYEADGLANNECNRRSAMKMQDGRLCFGSVIGVSIIDPAEWKLSREGRVPVHIYLTEFFRDTPDEAAATLDLLPLWQQNERIVFPATSRNLKIAFDLSNYAAPERSIFAYKIEGTDKDWHYINTQNKLFLNDLPIGRYNILIKGSGGKGRWSEPLVIPVQVEAFFYKQWWFFVLCALPFLGFLGLWLHRQRGERKRLEQEVKLRTQTIQKQADKLQVADEMKSRLYTNITHEFRTPLTVISGMAKMIKTMPDKAEELILRNSEGLLRLVNQMLDLAKLESGQLRLEPVQIDVIPFIQYLFESFQSFAEGKNIKLVFHKALDQLVMDCDENKLGSVISNLLSNAIKFSEENGQVLLNLQEEKGQLLIRIADQGVGIPPDKLPHIFDRFYQVDNSTTRKGEGTGIGLTLTRELVELMGGSIRVQSPGPEGLGTEFTVSLPITHNASPTPDPSPKGRGDVAYTALSSTEFVAAPLPFGEGSGVGLPLLLLIEDNRDVVTYLKACLQDRYTIEWAANGAIGIERALEIIPDIIISDIMMPEKDGYEVCYTLKNDERTSHIPIILLTAKAHVESRLQGLRLGADAYLGKPFLKEELYIRLEKLIELRQKLQARYAGIDFSAPAVSVPNQTEPSPEDLFLRRVAQYIQDHLDELSFRIEDLCREMAMSESQLSRKLKALSGKTTALFIRSVRLQAARKLLESTEQNISEIAYATGFSDPNYFSRAFSQEFGVAPRFFRN